MRARLSRRVAELVGNVRRMIAVNRNLGFFTTGYNYLIQLIPALIVAPMFIRGDAEFGVIPQSAMAFSHLLGAFSLIVTQFQSISSYAAAGLRLGALSDAAEQAALPGASPIAIEEEGDDLAYQDLTLRSPLDGRVLLDGLSLAVPQGTRVLVAGPNESAKLALFRATAGIWEDGEGRILRPAPDEIMFLAERPYLPPGTLRQVLLRRGQEDEVPEERIALVLKELGLEPLLVRAGELDVERDWHGALSLGEQQLLAVARIALAAPRFALLQRIGTTLGAEQVARSLKLLASARVTYLTLGENNAGAGQYDALLELAADGAWSWRPAR
jgi:putative ATP-binding cassette transporter